MSTKQVREATNLLLTLCFAFSFVPDSLQSVYGTGLCSVFYLTLCYHLRKTHNQNPLNRKKHDVECSFVHLVKYTSTSLCDIFLRKYTKFLKSNIQVVLNFVKID